MARQPTSASASRAAACTHGAAAGPKAYNSLVAASRTRALSSPNCAISRWTSPGEVFSGEAAGRPVAELLERVLAVPAMEGAALADEVSIDAEVVVPAVGEALYRLLADRVEEITTGLRRELLRMEREEREQ